MGNWRAFSQVFTVAILVAAPPSMAGLLPCQQLDVIASPSAAALSPGKQVALILQAGLLEPQVAAILRQHFNIQVVDWQASPHHRWPADYRVSANSWADVLTRILEPYQLQLVIHPNRSAVVHYRTTAQLTQEFH